MPLIYTGYYPMTLRMIDVGVVPVSISATQPGFWLDMPKMPELAPPAHLIYAWKNKLITERQFTVAYSTEVLGKFGTAGELRVEILRRFYGNKPVALVCWEKPEDFCHRFLVADCLSFAGEHVPEWSGARGPVNSNLPFFRRRP